MSDTEASNHELSDSESSVSQEGDQSSQSGAQESEATTIPHVECDSKKEESAEKCVPTSKEGGDSVFVVKPNPKPVFGSAAKSQISFVSLTKAKEVVDFSEVSGKGCDETKPGEQEMKTVEVVTGEEDDVCKFSAKIRFFDFNPLEKSWMDRGPAIIKINEVDGKHRIVIRAEHVLKVLANFWISSVLRASSTQKRSIQISLLENEKVISYLIRAASPRDAESLLEFLGDGEERIL